MSPGHPLSLAEPQSNRAVLLETFLETQQYICPSCFVACGSHRALQVTLALARFASNGGLPKCLSLPALPQIPSHGFHISAGTLSDSCPQGAIHGALPCSSSTGPGPMADSNVGLSS